MSHLDPERLALVALGEPMTPDETNHVQQCDDCTIDLFELRRTVLVGRSTVEMGELETPPERVWDRIAAEVAESPVPAVADATPATSDAAVPVHSRTRTLTRAMMGLAASAALILALVGVWSVVRPPQVVEVAAATLAAFPDHPDAAGSAVVVEEEDGERIVRVELDTEESAGDGYREVWLITADATALVSLGILDGTEGEFAVPDDIDIHQYVLVDVSQEPLDGDPAHSGDSIVRGELDFA